MDYDTPDGTCVRDYIDVRDLAEAHILAVDAARKGCAIYDLGNDRGHSVREVVARAERVTGKQIPCVEFPRRAGEPPRLVASHERIRTELGWRPRRDLEEMIASAWAWRQRHPRGYPS